MPAPAHFPRTGTRGDVRCCDEADSELLLFRFRGENLKLKHDRPGLLQVYMANAGPHLVAS
jgi:hypothetical protein